MGRSVLQYRSAVRGLGGTDYTTFNALARGSDHASKSLAKLAGAAAGAGIVGGFVKKIVDANSEYQSNRILFEAMLQDQEKAEKLTNNLQQLAAQYGQSTAEVMKSAKGFAQVMGARVGIKNVKTEDIEELMKLTKAAAALDTENRGLSYTAFSFKEALQGVGAGDWRSMKDRLELNLPKEITTKITAEVKKGEFTSAIKMMKEAMEKGGVSIKNLEKLMMGSVATNVARVGVLIKQMFQTTFGDAFDVVGRAMYNMNEAWNAGISKGSQFFEYMKAQGTRVADALEPIVVFFRDLKNPTLETSFRAQVLLSIFQNLGSVIQNSAMIFYRFISGFLGIGNSIPKWNSIWHILGGISDILFFTGGKLGTLGDKAAKWGESIRSKVLPYIIMVFNFIKNTLLIFKNLISSFTGNSVIKEIAMKFIPKQGEPGYNKNTSNTDYLFMSAAIVGLSLAIKAFTAPVRILGRFLGRTEATRNFGAGAAGLLGAGLGVGLGSLLKRFGTAGVIAPLVLSQFEAINKIIPTALTTILGGSIGHGLGGMVGAGIGGIAGLIGGGLLTQSASQTEVGKTALAGISVAAMIALQALAKVDWQEFKKISELQRQAINATMGTWASQQAAMRGLPKLEYSMKFGTAIWSETMASINGVSKLTQEIHRLKIMEYKNEITSLQNSVNVAKASQGISVLYKGTYKSLSEIESIIGNFKSAIINSENAIIAATKGFDLGKTLSRMTTAVALPGLVSFGIDLLGSAAGMFLSDEVNRSIEQNARTTTYGGAAAGGGWRQKAQGIGFSLGSAATTTLFNVTAVGVIGAALTQVATKLAAIGGVAAMIARPLAFLGGPWGVGIAAGATAIYTLVNYMRTGQGVFEQTSASFQKISTALFGFEYKDQGAESTLAGLQQYSGPNSSFKNWTGSSPVVRALNNLKAGMATQDIKTGRSIYDPGKLFLQGGRSLVARRQASYDLVPTNKFRKEEQFSFTPEGVRISTGFKNVPIMKRVHKTLMQATTEAGSAGKFNEIIKRYGIEQFQMIDQLDKAGKRTGKKIKVETSAWKIARERGKGLGFVEYPGAPLAPGRLPGTPAMSELQGIWTSPKYKSVEERQQASLAYAQRSGSQLQFKQSDEWIKAQGAMVGMKVEQQNELLEAIRQAQISSSKDPIEKLEGIFKSINKVASRLEQGIIVTNVKELKEQNPDIDIKVNVDSTGKVTLTRGGTAPRGAGPGGIPLLNAGQ